MIDPFLAASPSHFSPNRLTVVRQIAPFEGTRKRQCHPFNRLPVCNPAYTRKDKLWNSVRMTRFGASELVVKLVGGGVSVNSNSSRSAASRLAVCRYRRLSCSNEFSTPITEPLFKGKGN